MSPRGRRPSILRIAAAGLLFLVGVGSGVMLAPLTSTATAASARSPDQPGPVDIGFAQDMIVHHQQAVTMARLVEGRVPPLINQLATEIDTEQTLEIGQLQGFLSVWNAPYISSGPPMSWMRTADTEVPGSGRTGMVMSSARPSATDAKMMPGMATQGQLNSLANASGEQLETQFLQLMLRHHLGGITMAGYVANHSTLPAVRSLATRMYRDQIEEARELHVLLNQPGGPPR
jgi:uncharacterized protein (DUF305 family)